MKKIQLKILGISAGQATTSYTLILEEENGERKLPIVIGVLEAQAIAIQIEKIEPIRPMTHDLFKSFSTSFKIRIKEVIIHQLKEGIFYSNIIATDGKEVKEIDSRTSDAIALALRFNCPIYTYENILRDAGIALKSLQISDLKKEDIKQDAEIEDDDTERKDTIDPKSDKNLYKLPLSKLKKMLENAIIVEDYIFAAKVRDAIKEIDPDKSVDDTN